jgi:hypothetical protein
LNSAPHLFNVRGHRLLPVRLNSQIDYRAQQVSGAHGAVRPPQRLRAIHRDTNLRLDSALVLHTHSHATPLFTKRINGIQSFSGHIASGQKVSPYTTHMCTIRVQYTRRPWATHHAHVFKVIMKHPSTQHIHRLIGTMKLFPVGARGFPRPRSIPLNLYT